MKVRFTNLATATIREHWESEVTDGLGGDALTDALHERLLAGDVEAYADDEIVGDERDRDIEPDSVERL